MKDEIKLSWCKKHREWYQFNCSECMAESVADEIFGEIERAYPYSILEVNAFTWQALKTKYLKDKK